MQGPRESLAAQDAKTLAILQTAHDQQQQGELQMVRGWFPMTQNLKV